MKILAIDIWRASSGRDCVKVTVDLGPLPAREGHQVAGNRIYDAWVNGESDRALIKPSIIGKEIEFQSTWSLKPVRADQRDYSLNINSIVIK